MGKLLNKVAIVTGSGRGIGREIAIKLASEGARVVVNDIDAAPAEETVEAITAIGGSAIPYIGNVTDKEFGQRFVGAAINGFGGLDIIINNAGYTWDAVIHKMSDEQWDAILDVHLTAPFKLLRAASDYIREQARKEAAQGIEVFRKVVNISSISGVAGNAGQSNYSAAKAGTIGLTKALAKEWGRYKVNVNAVAYGLIKTRLTEAWDAETFIDVGESKVRVGMAATNLQEVEASIPLGRGGTKEESANAVYLFCIPESNYISGQVLICDGGAY